VSEQYKCVSNSFIHPTKSASREKAQEKKTWSALHASPVEASRVRSSARSRSGKKTRASPLRTQKVDRLARAFTRRSSSVFHSLERVGMNEGIEKYEWEKKNCCVSMFFRGERGGVISMHFKKTALIRVNRSFPEHVSSLMASSISPIFPLLPSLTNW